MGSVYEKVVDTSHNPPSTANQRQRLDPSIKEKIVKTGLEPIFTKVDSELAHSDEEFRTKSSQLSNVEKTSEAGKLGISTYGMADTLNEGEREKDHVKENMGDSQKNKNVDAD